MAETINRDKGDQIDLYIPLDYWLAYLTNYPGTASSNIYSRLTGSVMTKDTPIGVKASALLLDGIISLYWYRNHFLGKTGPYSIEDYFDYLRTMYPGNSRESLTLSVLNRENFISTFVDWLNCFEVICGSPMPINFRLFNASLETFWYQEFSVFSDRIPNGKFFLTWSLPGESVHALRDFDAICQFRSSAYFPLRPGTMRSLPHVLRPHKSNRLPAVVNIVPSPAGTEPREIYVPGKVEPITCSAMDFIPLELSYLIQ